MKNLPPKQIRVLGLAPSSRGVGFALMEGAGTLVDWGVKSVKSGDKNNRSLSHVGNLIEHYAPSVIAIEDAQGSRRGPRVQSLIKQIVAMARHGNIKVARVSRKQMNLGIFKNEEGTKHALAEQLATRFPEELGFRLPGKRRAWMSEDHRMDIFEAVALAEHCLGQNAA